MPDLDPYLVKLPDRHQRALRWFAGHAGQTVSWPEPLPDGTLLVCRPKGIYKPAWSEYALSVRHSLGTLYADEPPVTVDAGGWVYRYFQESKELTARDEKFTNVGLMACKRDQVPVGVMIQVLRKPSPKYEILGVGLVQEWEAGYFPIASLPA